jgi:hypothetical protein
VSAAEAMKVARSLVSAKLRTRVFILPPARAFRTRGTIQTSPRSSALSCPGKLLPRCLVPKILEPANFFSRQETASASLGHMKPSTACADQPRAIVLSSA